MSDNESTAPVVDEVEQSLYAKREKIYPREVHGMFAWLRTSGVLILLGFYYIIPWLQWDERQMLCLICQQESFTYLVWFSGHKIFSISHLY